MNIHGIKLMEKVEDHRGFIMMWRSLFIITMNPSHLSLGWQADKNIFTHFGVDPNY
jgi:hypothetical protein